MNIVCPDCGYTREVPDEKLPPKAATATCPKCGTRFRFRDLPEEPARTVPAEKTEQVAPAPEEHASPEPKQHHADREVPPLKEATPPPASSASPEPVRYDLTEPEDLEEPVSAPEGGDIWSRLEAFDDRDDAGGTAGHETAGEMKSVPWETLEQHGFFRGFLLTAKGVMRRPVSFFRSMPVGAGYGKPLVFYLLIAELQAVAQFVWQMSGVLPMVSEMQDGAMIGMGLLGFGSALTLVMYPVMLTLMLFFIVGINHICLTLMKASQKGFEGTFRAVTYGSAPMLLCVFPIVGPLVGALWSMVTTFFGYREIHGTTTMRVVLAMLLPVLILTAISLIMVTGSNLGIVP